MLLVAESDCMAQKASGGLPDARLLLAASEPAA